VVVADLLGEVVVVGGEEDVEDAEAVVEVDADEVVVVLVSARVMFRMPVAESVTVAPSAQTAMENKGEYERSLLVATVHGKDVALTWSSVRGGQAGGAHAQRRSEARKGEGEEAVRVINSKVLSASPNEPLKAAAWLALS
jgi:hypothetical protein